MLLLRAEVKAFPGDLQSEQVFVELEAFFRVTNNDRCMINSQEKRVVVFLPFRVSLALGEAYLSSL